MTPDDISKLAFLLYPLIVKSKPDFTSTESLAARIKGIQKGLLPEDEFAATVCWLGNCGGIHRIDQSPMPLLTMTEKMRAPDFIAFTMLGNRPTPILVEVKSHHDTSLDWSASYLMSLRRFAECLHLPLLVAWKCGDLWTLVDVEHFEKNVTAYRLTLEKAFREDLFCVLFRNLRIQMNSDLELILDMTILDEVVGDTDTLLPEGPFRMKIVHVGFYRGGVEIEQHQPYSFWLFLATPDQAELRRTGKQTCQQVFRPLPNHGFSLSNVLVAQLSLGSGAEPLDWHGILTAGAFPSSGGELRDSLPGAIERGFVHYVMDIVPNTWPVFLPDEKQWLASTKSQGSDA